MPCANTNEGHLDSLGGKRDDLIDRPSTNSAAIGRRGKIGLRRKVGLCTLAMLGITVLVPPWDKVDCQWYKEELGAFPKKVHKQSFAGYDFLFAGSKWEYPPHQKNGTIFDFTVFRIQWPLLICEWGVLIVAGCLVCAFCEKWP